MITVHPRATVSEDGVLDALRAGWARLGRQPTIREYCRKLKCHASTVLKYLDRLEADGKIERERGPGRCRGCWPTGLRQRIRELVTSN